MSSPLHQPSDRRWNTLFSAGAYCTVIALAAIVVDLVIGSATGGDLALLPQTAADRFAEFRTDPLLGLYHLDLLNVFIQMMLIPGYCALFAAHRGEERGIALLALMFFMTGTALFTANNTALPMLELSRKFAAAETEVLRTQFAAAGEAMIAQGAHGSPGVFFSFLLPNVAGAVMSLAMLRGKVFSSATAYAGIAGSVLMMWYVILVTFVPGVQNMATAFAAPGGLLLMTWMGMFTKKMFTLRKQ